MSSSVHPTTLDSSRIAPHAAALAVAVAHGFVAPAAVAAAATGAAGAPSDVPVELAKVTVAETKTAPISSPKFTQPLVDTPQTIAVIPQEVFNQQGGATLTDVLRNTPGITFLAGEGGNASSADGDAFFLRGFDASNSIFIDGVRDTGQYSRDVFNLEQVEIAKGAAGSDTGRGVASGYVNLSTKSPRLESFAAGSLSYGSGERKRATLDINQPLASGSIKGVALRVNALWQEGGVAGRNTVEENRWSLAPSLALGLGTPTRVQLAYQHSKNDDIPDYGLPRGAMPGAAGAGSFSPVPPAVSQKTFYGTVHDFEDVESRAFTGRLEHDFNATTRIVNQTRVSDTERQVILTAPTSYTAATGLVTRSRQGNQRENKTISNLTTFIAQLQSGNVRHAISAGAEYLYEKQFSPSFASVTLPVGTPLTNPDITSAVPAPALSGASNWGGIETIAFYLFDTARLSERWLLSGGLRWETYEANYRSIATTAVATRLNIEDSLLSGKVGLTFKPSAAGSLYVSYGNSLRPPGTNFTASNTGTSADNLSLDPQEAHNFELGVKWDFFRGRLATTAALFRTENTKVATTDAVSGAVVQQNDQIVEGVELGISGKITDQWLIFGGVSLLDPKYSAPATSANATTDGARLQWTPRVSGNLWTTYRLPIGLTFGGGAQYMGKTARQTTNTPAAAMPDTPSYWLVNALVSYPVSKHVTVRFNANNVFDKFYLQSLNNNANRYNPGTPRSYVISADLRF